MSQIKRIRWNDIDEVVDLGREMHAESSYNFLPFNSQKLELLLANCVIDPNKVAYIATNNGRIVGIIIGQLTDYYFSDKLLATDLGLFITKKFRGYSIGPRLVKAFVEWAKEKGCSEISINITSGIENERVALLLEHLGFDRTGISMKRRL